MPRGVRVTTPASSSDERGAMASMATLADTVDVVSRYTPPSDDQPESPLRRRPRSVRIGVWVLLVGVVALVFADVFAALL